jgi:hypothetical protein
MEKNWPDDHFSTVVNTMRALRETTSFRKMLTLTEELHPDQLSNGINYITDAFGTVQERPSDLETYYLRRSQALMYYKRPHDCLALCYEALQRQNPFWNGNEMWIKWRLARSLAAINRPLAAEKLLRHIVEVYEKDDNTFFTLDLASFLWETDRCEESLHTLVRICMYKDMHGPKHDVAALGQLTERLLELRWLYTAQLHAELYSMEAHLQGLKPHKTLVQVQLPRIWPDKHIVRRNKARVLRLLRPVWTELLLAFG